MFDFFVMDPIIGFYFFCLSGYVQICGRPQINFTRSSEKYIQFLYKHFVSNNRKLFIIAVDFFQLRMKLNFLIEIHKQELYLL